MGRDPRGTPMGWSIWAAPWPYGLLPALQDVGTLANEAAEQSLCAAAMGVVASFMGVLRSVLSPGNAVSIG